MPLQYRDGQFNIDGEPITPEDLVALRDQVVEGWAEELAEIARAELGIATQGRPEPTRQIGFLQRSTAPVQAIEFPMGRIESFAARFLQKVSTILSSAYVFARGGLEAMQDESWRTVADLVARQETFAQGFVEALRGGQVSEAQAVARAKQYAGSAIEAFERGKLAQVGFDAPVYPTQDCEGMTQCRCWWEVQEFPDRYEGTWHAVGDRMTCGPCRQHARQYNPLKQMKPERGRA